MEKNLSQWQEDQLREENKFLKMKLMLENGAEFGGTDGINPQIENKFLKDIIEFEKRYDQNKEITVFERLGMPTHFKAPSEVKDEEIEKEWESLSLYMYRHGISLGVCSPNVSLKELYRFTLDELFFCCVDNIKIPGLITGFIYDEFYPDVPYDNTRLATENCIQYILSNQPLEWIDHFKDKDLRLNEHYSLTKSELKSIITRFKAAYEDIEMDEIGNVQCIFKEKTCIVTGSYLVTVNTGVETYKMSGQWKVELEQNENWRISSIEIGNIRF